MPSASTSKLLSRKNHLSFDQSNISHRKTKPVFPKSLYAPMYQLYSVLPPDLSCPQSTTDAKENSGDISMDVISCLFESRRPAPIPPGQTEDNSET
eukprot:jgi/Botrbrau1/2388/Bobra.0395s0020.1